jgi:hypothetical protein
MPEIIEISGLDDVGQEQPDGKRDFTQVGIAIAVLGGAVLVLGVLVPMFFGKKEAAGGLGDLGVIKRCRAEDRDPNRSKRDQQWCLWDSKGKKILGRHPSRERALRQERLIQVRKHG